MRWALLFLISLFTIRAIAQTCPTEKLAFPLTPESLQSFLKNSKIKKVEDVVCCLPDQFRNNYTGFHSSFAGQAGVPDHPRVVLHNSDTSLKNFNMAITITGDDKNLHGANHIEVLYNNSVKGEVELYDINFDKNHTLSEKNPKFCLGCHGPNAKDDEAAGPKPIFTDFPWPYAVGAMDGFHLGVEGNKSRTYFNEIDRRAIHAVETQPRYACLTKPDGKAKFADPTNLDEITTHLNDRRVAKLILATPDYLRFRPLIVGASLKCIPAFATTEENLHLFENEFAKWVPPGADRAFFNNDRFILPKYRDVQNLRQAYEDSNQEAVNQESAIRQKRNQQPPDQIGENPVIFYPTTDRYAVYNDHFSMKDMINIYHVTSLKGFSPVTQLLARYDLDSQTQHNVGFGQSPLVRLLFEGRGISTLSWSKGMAGDEKTTLNISGSDLREASPNDAFWKEIGPLVDLISHTNSLAGNQGEEARKKACAILQKQSFQNFSNGAVLPASLSTSTPTQGTK